MTKTIGQKFYKKFSFPINMEEIFHKKTIDFNWFYDHKDLIKEVYIEPSFMGMQMKDMNGKNLAFDHVEVYLFLVNLKAVGIDVCVTLNDIFCDRVALFEDFRKTYKGFSGIVDSIVVPDNTFLRLKAEFPDLTIKNTVINTPTYEEVKRGWYDSFDYIYVHDDIIHNHDKWLEIKGDRKFGTVVNYGDCVSYCEKRKKHYELVRMGHDDLHKYFCPSTKFNDFEMTLKRCAIPGMLSEFEYYLDVIDVYKLQGRNRTGTFSTAVDIIESIHRGCDGVFGGYDLIKRLPPEVREEWKVKVRNCTGDCHECEWCDGLKEIY